jgi:hypothetical protein
MHNYLKATSQQISDLYLQRLQELNLTHTLMQSLAESFPQTNTFNILSIGCGDEPLEIPALEDFFKTQKYTFNYIGIDIEAADIQTCKNKYAEKTNYQFHVISGTDHIKIKELFANKDIHIIILRHPVLYPNHKVTPIFISMITTSVPYLLSPGGTLLTSLHFKEEKNLFLELMKSVTFKEPQELLTCSRNYIRQEAPDNFFKQPVTLYADQYFIAITKFQPTPLIKAEKQNDFSPLKISSVLINEFIQKLHPQLESADIKNLLFKAFKEVTSHDISLKESISNQLAWEIEKKIKYDNENLKEFIEYIFGALSKIDLNEDIALQFQANIKLILERGMPAKSLTAADCESEKSRIFCAPGMMGI